jgi:poly(3-hydroxybutyrate) depolymerase
MRSDIRAVASHSGGTHPLDGCSVDHKPIIMFHGSTDPIVPPGCEDPNASAVSGTQPAAAAWAAKNGCQPTTTATPVHNGTCFAYDGCPADAQVTLCTFDHMGHCWAGGQSASLFACSDYESATELEWQFFTQHAW